MLRIRTRSSRLSFPFLTFPSNQRGRRFSSRNSPNRRSVPRNAPKPKHDGCDERRNERTVKETRAWRCEHVEIHALERAWDGVGTNGSKPCGTHGMDRRRRPPEEEEKKNGELVCARSRRDAFRGRSNLGVCIASRGFLSCEVSFRRSSRFSLGTRASTRHLSLRMVRSSVVRVRRWMVSIDAFLETTTIHQRNEMKRNETKEEEHCVPFHIASIHIRPSRRARSILRLLFRVSFCVYPSVSSLRIPEGRSPSICHGSFSRFPFHLLRGHPSLLETIATPHLSLSLYTPSLSVPLCQILTPTHPLSVSVVRGGSGTVVDGEGEGRGHRVSLPIAILPG